MTKQELLQELEHLGTLGDTEAEHVMADKLLIEYIDDEDIKKWYEAIDKWYA